MSGWCTTRRLNYSKINNFGAAACRGDYFLLLNNDTEMIDGGCIRRCSDIVDERMSESSVQSSCMRTIRSSMPV